MKKVLLIGIIGACSFTGRSQVLLADTFNIRISDDVQMMVAMENASKMESSNSVDRIYRALEQEIPSIVHNRDLDEIHIRLNYLVQGNAAEIQWSSQQKRHGISIDSTGASQQVLMDRDTIFMGLRPEQTVTLVFKHIEERASLENVDLDSLINNAKSALQGDINRHTAFAANFEHAGNSEVKSTGLNARNLDRIEITASVGLGLLRHDITPRIDASISFDFLNKRAQLHNKLKLNTSFLYSFISEPEGKNSMYINGFVGLEYSHNFSRSEESLYGIGIHYLAWKNGPVFGEGDTWKINVAYYNAKYRLQIQPELYITNNFKKAFPGMSVLFGF